MRYTLTRIPVLTLFVVLLAFWLIYSTANQGITVPLEGTISTSTVLEITVVSEPTDEIEVVAPVASTSEPVLEATASTTEIAETMTSSSTDPLTTSAELVVPSTASSTATTTATTIESSTEAVPAAVDTETSGGGVVVVAQDMNSVGPTLHGVSLEYVEYEDTKEPSPARCLFTIFRRGECSHNSLFLFR